MKQKLILCITALYMFSFGFSQTKLAAKDTGEIRGILETAKEMKQRFSGDNFTPFGSSSLSNLLSNVSISSVLKKGENGKVELKYNGPKYLTFGLSVDQKIGKNDNSATPFDLLDGLSPGTTVEFNFQKIIWQPVLSRENFNSFNKAANSFSKSQNTDRRGVTYNDILKKGTDDEKKILNSFKLKQPLFFNIKASITQTNFSYTTDSFTLSKIENKHLTPSFGIFFGVPFSIKSFLSFNYTYSNSYEDADEINFSSRFGTSNNTYTRTLSFGAPQEKSDNKIAAEWRTNFNNSTHTVSIGLGPSLVYGITSKKLATYLPIYFIRGKDDKGKPTGLQGGVRFGFATSTKKGQASSFKDGFGAQLIITAPFDVFGNL